MKNTICFLLFFLMTSSYVQYSFAQQVGSNEIKAVVKDSVERPIPPPPLLSPLKEEKIYRVVENMPRFPGCEGKGSIEEIKRCSEQELTKFLYKNLNYPEEAIKNKIEGLCVVQFTIEKDGLVGDIDLVRNIGYGCGQETIRLVNLMKEKKIRWGTGRARSRPVSVRFTLPVKFDLDKIKNEKEHEK